MKKNSILLLNTTLIIISIHLISTKAQEDICSSETFPFIFYDSNQQPVDGNPIDGICTFPNSDCGINSSNTTGQCCKPRSVVTGTNYMFIAFSLIFIPQFFIHRYFHAIYKKDPTLLDNVNFDSIPNWISNNRILKYLSWVWGWGIWVAVAALVAIPTIMKPSIQANLVVTSRNVLQSAEAFLIPYKEIFKFVEDIVNVKINYALSSGDLAGANTLVHLGIAGSILTGLFASLLASILGVIPPVLTALTNPGIKNDMEIYTGCDIIEEGASETLIIPYWFIEVWSFPGTQITMVLVGFMYGALEYNTVGWFQTIGILMLPLIWFTCLSKPIEPLILLAAAEFAVPYVTVVLVVLYLITPLGSDIRKNTGVSLSLTKLCTSFRSLFRVIGRSCSRQQSGTTIDQQTQSQAETQSPRADDATEEDVKADSVKDLIKEGLSIMCLDVGAQFCKSLAIYLALTTDAAVGYQLTALDSYLPSYGIAYTTGMSFAFKIIGPIFLSLKEYGYFFKLARVYLICAFLLVPLIIGCTVPFKEGLALESGQNACEYAGSTECVPFFTNVYGPNVTGGRFTLFDTYNAFAFGSIVESIYILVRAIMLSMLEFRYIVRSTGVALIFYIVAIILVSLVQPFAKQAISYWIAIFVPQAVLIFLFLGRLCILFRRMVKGSDNLDDMPAAATVDRNEECR